MYVRGSRVGVCDPRMFRVCKGGLIRFEASKWNMSRVYWACVNASAHTLFQHTNMKLTRPQGLLEGIEGLRLTRTTAADATGARPRTRAKCAMHSQSGNRTETCDNIHSGFTPRALPCIQSKANSSPRYLDDGDLGVARRARFSLQHGQLVRTLYLLQTR